MAPAVIPILFLAADPTNASRLRIGEEVIAMDREIEDEAALAFSAGFYQGLGAGRSIEDAYRLGCV